VDIAALAEAVPLLDAFALWDVQNVMRVELGQKYYPPSDATFAMTPTVGKVTPALKEVMGLGLADGRFISTADLQYNRPVCVIGAGMHRRLGGGQVIGEELAIKMLKWDGTYRSRVQQTFTIVGVLQPELPLLAALPVSDMARWALFPHLINSPRPGQLHGMAYGMRAFQALQRQQLVLSRLIGIDEAVFIPWTADGDVPAPTAGTLVYLSVSVPDAPGSRRLLLDQETMEAGRAKTAADPCEECEDACRAGALVLQYHMPQGLLDVANDMRAVLRSRLGEDRLFQFMWMETLGDTIRFELRWLNWLLGAIIIAGLFLGSIPLMAGTALLRRTTSAAGPTSGEDVLQVRRTRPDALSAYTRMCLFSVGVTVIAGGVLSYWLVTRVLRWY